MKTASDTDRLLVKAAIVKRDDPFMGLGEAARIVEAGRVVETGRNKKLAIAYINESKWVADCPSEWCRGAELIAPGHDMLCADCGMVSKVKWPKDRVEIERLLNLRPDPFRRNWLPHETVNDLLAENIEHGIWEN